MDRGRLTEGPPDLGGQGGLTKERRRQDVAAEAPM